MNKFIELIKRFSHYIVFGLLALISTILILNSHQYHNASFFSSSNAFAASIYNAKYSVVRYIGLSNRNAELQEENRRLRRLTINNFDKVSADTFSRHDTSYHATYHFIDAEVIKNSLNKKSNYLTINRGSTHGVKKGMGVVGPLGIVGIVKAVSLNFATVISCLNTEEFGVSSTINPLGLNDGVLKWEGVDPRIISLEGINKFEKLKKGMEVVTGPYTRRFPKASSIGTLKSIKTPLNGAFYELEVELSTNFKTVREVYVVMDVFEEELESLEQEDEE